MSIRSGIGNGKISVEGGEILILFFEESFKCDSGDDNIFCDISGK